MTFQELVDDWFPVAQDIAKTNGVQQTQNLIKGLLGGK